MKKSTEQQVLALFVQAMRTALALIDDKEKTSTAKPGRRDASQIAPGIYPAKSKYNPFRAYVWNGEKSIYLGMFPSINKAKAAQRDYRKGQPPKEGTRVANHRPPLEVVQKVKVA